MRALLFNILITFCTVFATQSYGQIQDWTDFNNDSVTKDIQQSINYIDRHYTSLYQNGRFNGNILIAQKGQVIYKKSLGYAVKSTGERLTGESSFQLASTSKPFTAAAILILYERGQLDIDDLVTEYYPNFPYKKVTIRHLLSHRSGLPDYLNYGGLIKKTYISNQDVMNMFEKNRPKALATPNTVFKYNNSNYAVLAALVEKISGESFSEFCDKNIFQPLDMKNTWVWHPTQARNKNQTYGYNGSWTLRKPDKFDGVAGDKGVYSTAEDLLKWDQSWYNNTLLKASTIEAAYEGQTKGRSGKDYGLGWRTQDLSGDKKMIYHNGWWHDYNIVFKRFIHDSLTIIILSNKYNQSVYNTSVIENSILNDHIFDRNINDLLFAQKDEDEQDHSQLDLHPFNKPTASNTPMGQGENTDESTNKINSTPKYYVVKKGDTLFNISQRFNVTVEMLKKWNRMASANIQLGQKLLIENKGNE